MKSVISILEELEATQGTNAKRDILEENSKNELLKRALVAAQDPYVVYYVNKFKMPHAARVHDDDVIIEDLLDLVLPKLSSRALTGNDAKAWVIDAFSSMDEKQQKWCQRILLKNLRCGVQASTLNKVWPGTIVPFSVQLANTLRCKHDPDKGIVIDEEVSYPTLVEPKLDGLRCIAVKHGGVVNMFTRNGSPIETLDRIKGALELAPYDDVVLDGEAMGADWAESASIVMSHKRKKDDVNIVYHVFDAIPYTDWVDQTAGDPLRDRLELADAVVGLIDDGSKPGAVVKHVKGVIVNNEPELMAYYAKALDGAYEGVMLKNLNSPYCFKRSNAVMKMKPIITYEGVVVGHYEGRRGTKHEGMWGGFDVMLPNRVITRIGGGFNDAFRVEVQLAGPDTYIGKIFEIEGQPDPTTKDGLTVDGKVRFPVFVRIRDRNDVDNSVAIIADEITGKK